MFTREGNTLQKALNRLAFVLCGALAGMMLWSPWEGKTSPEDSAIRHDTSGDRGTASRSQVVPADNDPRASVRDVPRPREDEHGAILVLTVVDEDRRALTAASVCRETEDEASPLGTTDASGRLEVPRNRIPDGWISASLGGYPPQVIPVPPESTEAAEIVLRPGGAIEGRVRWPDGSAVGAGYIVYTVPGRTDEDTFRKALRGCVRPDIRVARTDGNGEFRVDGLEPTSPVRVFAGGTGGWMASAVTAESGTTLDLEVDPMYGARVHLREDDGGALQTSRKLRGFSMSWWSVDPRAEPCNYGRGGTLRALIHPDWMDGVWRYVGDDHRLLLFRSESRVDSVGPVYFSVSIPGYATKQISLYPSRLDGAVLDVNVGLHPIAEGWGRLEVYVDGALESSLPVGRRQSGKVLGAIKMKDIHKGGVLSAAVTYPIDKPIRIDGLPFGFYEVYFLSEIGGTRVPELGSPLFVNVGFEPAECHLLLSGYGGVDIEVLARDGTPYEGPATFMVMSDIGEETFTGDEVQFQEPPYTYVIEGLQPKEYKIRLQEISGQRLSAPYPEVEVRVVSDELVSCRIAIRP